MQKLPAFPGKARAGRALLGNRMQERDVVVRAGQARYMVPQISEPIAFFLLIDGVYEPATQDFILRRLKPGGVFVDVGANIGVFAVPAARKVGNQGRVLALEASPHVFPYLRRNIVLNGLTTVTPIHVAVSDAHQDQIAFYEAPSSSFGMGSLAPQFDGRATPVSAETLDSLLEEHGVNRVQVLKVDVEGHEAAVFRGARQLLTGPHPPAIVFEFCDWAEARFPGGYPGQAQEVLSDMGYRIWPLNNVDGEPLEQILSQGTEMLVAFRDPVSHPL